MTTIPHPDRTIVVEDLGPDLVTATCCGTVSRSCPWGPALGEDARILGQQHTVDTGHVVTISRVGLEQVRPA